MHTICNIRNRTFSVSVVFSSHSGHTRNFSDPRLNFCNSPGKIFTYWRKGKAFPERNLMNALLGRSSEGLGSPCWISVPNFTSTAGPGWRSCKIWLGSHGLPPWSCWMWSHTWGIVPAFPASECGQCWDMRFGVWVSGWERPLRIRTWVFRVICVWGGGLGWISYRAIQENVY